MARSAFWRNNLNIRLILIGVMALLAAGCPSKAPQAPSGGASDVAAKAEAVAKGKAVYMARCIACHNMDAKQPGSLGPEVVGSSLELLKARIIDGTYPEGYKPKRTTKLMVPIPDLKPEDLENLAVYLNQ